MPSPERTNELIAQNRDHNNETLTGAKSLTWGDAVFQRLDPGGSGRTITLPPENRTGAFWISNWADAAENLTIQDDGSNTIMTLNQNEAGWVSCDGTNWRTLGVITIARS